MGAESRSGLAASAATGGVERRKLLGLEGNPLTISVTELITGIGGFLTTPFWALYVLALGASLPSLGLLQLLSGLLGVLLMMPGGHLADRIGRKKPIVIGGLFTASGSILQALAQDWVQLIPGMILSAGLMMTWPARQSMVADGLPASERVRGFAAFFTLMMLPSAVMPMVSGYVTDYQGLIPGMRLSFIASGLLTLASSVIRARFLEESAAGREQSHSVQGAGRRSVKGVLVDTFEPLSIKAVRTLFVGTSGIVLIFGLQQSLTSVFAVDVVGLSKTEWGLVSASMGFVSLFIRIPISRLTIRLGETKSIIISQFGRSVYPAAFALSTNALHMALLGFGYTLAFNLGSPAFQALLTEVTPPEKRGRVYGLWGMIWGGFSSLTPSLAAAVWESLGPSSPFYMASAAGALSSIYLLSRRDSLKPL